MPCRNKGGLCLSIVGSSFREERRGQPVGRFFLKPAEAEAHGRVLCAEHEIFLLDALVLEDALHRAQGKIRAVVFLAQVREKDGARPFLKANERPGRRAVREVAAVREDALLQVPRVGAFLQHLPVVVCLEYEKIGAFDGMEHAVGQKAEVGRNGAFSLPQTA